MGGPPVVSFAQAFNCEFKNKSLPGNSSCQGICGGGGYVLSRWAIEAMVGHPTPMSRKAFVATQMQHCRKCGTWADLALSQVMLQLGGKIQRINWGELHGW